MSDLNRGKAKPPDTISFYEIAAKFVEETSNSSQPHRLLKEWAHRYPEYASDLAAIAYANLIVPGDDGMLATRAAEAAVVETANQMLSRLKQVQPPLTSLTSAIKARGIQLSSFVSSLRIDLPLLARLEQRHLIVDTIPGSLIDRLASSIGRSRSDVIAYLSQPSRLAASASYKSRTAPSIAGSNQISFLDALDGSDKLAPSDKSYWKSQVALSENQQ